jgi:alkylhydroperoxidase family enzyme
MPQRRPAQPRLPVIEKVAQRAREQLSSDGAQPVNLRATLAVNREVSKAMAALAGVLLNGSIDPRLRELCILRMGWDIQAVYEFGQHTLIGRRVGLTPDEVYLVTRPLTEGGWGPVERVVLQMTDDLAADDCVSEVTWTELEGHLSPSEIVEFMAVVMCYRMAGAVMNSCGIQLDEGVPGWPSAPG